MDANKAEEAEAAAAIGHVSVEKEAAQDSSDEESAASDLDDGSSNGAESIASVREDYSSLEESLAPRDEVCSLVCGPWLYGVFRKACICCQCGPYFCNSLRGMASAKAYAEHFQWLWEHCKEVGRRCYT